MEIRTNIKKPPSMPDIMWSHYEKTLRDDFAKNALLGLLISTPRCSIDEDQNFLAKEAYILADAMLQARKK